MTKTKTQILSSLIIAIVFSALFFYLLEVLFADLFYIWINSNSNNLMIIMLIGFLIAIIIAMYVNHTIWEKVNFRNHLVAIIVSLILTITIEFFVALLYLFYYNQFLGMEFSFTIIFKTIIYASYYAFSNVTWIWIITQIIFSIFYTLLIYDYWTHSRPIIIDSRQVKYKSNNKINDKLGITIYYILSYGLNTILFMTTFELYIEKMDQTVAKFLYIFILSLFGGIITTGFAYYLYTKIGNKKYRDFNSDKRQRRLQNLMSAIITTILTFTFIYSNFMAEATSITAYLTLFVIFRVGVNILSDYLSIIIFKGR